MKSAGVGEMVMVNVNVSDSRGMVRRPGVVLEINDENIATIRVFIIDGDETFYTNEVSAGTTLVRRSPRSQGLWEWDRR